MRNAIFASLLMLGGIVLAQQPTAPLFPSADDETRQPYYQPQPNITTDNHTGNLLGTRQPNPPAIGTYGVTNPYSSYDMYGTNPYAVPDGVSYPRNYPLPPYGALPDYTDYLSTSPYSVATPPTVWESALLTQANSIKTTLATVKSLATAAGKTEIARQATGLSNVLTVIITLIKDPDTAYSYTWLRGQLSSLQSQAQALLMQVSVSGAADPYPYPPYQYLPYPYPYGNPYTSYTYMQLMMQINQLKLQLAILATNPYYLSDYNSIMADLNRMTSYISPYTSDEWSSAGSGYQAAGSYPYSPYGGRGYGGGYNIYGSDYRNTADTNKIAPPQTVQKFLSIQQRVQALLGQAQRQ